MYIYCKFLSVFNLIEGNIRSMGNNYIRWKIRILDLISFASNFIVYFDFKFLKFNIKLLYIMGKNFI